MALYSWCSSGGIPYVHTRNSQNSTKFLHWQVGSDIKENGQVDTKETQHLYKSTFYFGVKQMKRNQSESDAWELDYEFHFRSLAMPTQCRDLSGKEKRNHAARYNRRPASSATATKGIHRRGQRRTAA